MTIQTAFDQVTQQINLLNQYAGATLAAANLVLNSILSTSAPNVDANADFNSQAPPGVKEAKPLGALENIPNPASLNIDNFHGRSIRAISVSGEPSAPPDPGTPDFPPAPAISDVTVPPAPTLSDPGPVPTYEDSIIGIPFPELFDIQIPPVPTINLDGILFTSQRPIFTGTDIDASQFAYQDENYASQFVEDLKEKIYDMMDGRSGLPIAVETALFERAREREQELIDRTVEEANEEWAARGFAVPPGPLNKRVSRVRQEGNAKISQLNRDQFIEAWKIQIEQFKFALAQGIALEELFVRMFIERQNRRLQAARFAVDIAIAVYNAKVARLQAEVTAYEADARVYRERLQAELARVQMYAEQVRAQQVIGELNQQLVQIYGERVRTVLANVDLFRARIQAYQSLIEAERAKIERFRSEVEAARALVDTNTARVQQYATQIQAESTKLDSYKVRADIYGTKVQAWAQQVNANIESARLDAQALAAEADAFRSQMDAVRTRLESDRIRIGVVSENNQRRLQAYQAESQGVASYNNALIEQAQVRIANAKAKADIEVQNANINISNASNIFGMLLKSRETVAQVLAQLSAGAMSAASVSAQIGGTSTDTRSVSYNFSGTLPEGTIIG